MPPLEPHTQERVGGPVPGLLRQPPARSARCRSPALNSVGPVMRVAHPPALGHLTAWGGCEAKTLGGQWQDCPEKKSLASWLRAGVTMDTVRTRAPRDCLHDRMSATAILRSHSEPDHGAAWGCWGSPEQPGLTVKWRRRGSQPVLVI